MYLDHPPIKSLDCRGDYGFTGEESICRNLWFFKSKEIRSYETEEAGYQMDMPATTLYKIKPAARANLTSNIEEAIFRNIQDNNNIKFNYLYDCRFSEEHVRPIRIYQPIFPNYSKSKILIAYSIAFRVEKEYFIDFIKRLRLIITMMNDRICMSNNRLE